MRTTDYMMLNPAAFVADGKRFGEDDDYVIVVVDQTQLPVELRLSEASLVALALTREEYFVAMERIETQPSKDNDFEEFLRRLSGPPEKPSED